MHFDGPETKDRLDLSVVVPLFNEEQNIAELYRRLTRTLETGLLRYEIIFVDDGSDDATPILLDALGNHDARVAVLHLSRNFGHQPAISAGLDHSRGQSVAVLDGDLQDPPELIPELIRLWQEGNEVVYATRRHRKEGLFKRAGYFLFYRLLHSMSDLEIPLDSGDFCLMDRRVVDVVINLPERQRFIRGLRTFAGFRQVGIQYDRPAREAGKPKYTLRALVGLAIDGLVSFSSYPLRLVTHLGIASACIAFGLTAWALADAIFNGSSPRGWASTIVVVLFMSAIQLISLGIMGEYVRRVFIETKGRPTYIVRGFHRRGASSLDNNRRARTRDEDELNPVGR